MENAESRKLKAEISWTAEAEELQGVGGRNADEFDSAHAHPVGIGEIAGDGRGDSQREKQAACNAKDARRFK